MGKLLTKSLVLLVGVAKRMARPPLNTPFNFIPPRNVVQNAKCVVVLSCLENRVNNCSTHFFIPTPHLSPFTIYHRAAPLNDAHEATKNLLLSNRSV